jgi:hypothetical protein
MVLENQYRSLQNALKDIECDLNMHLYESSNKELDPKVVWAVMRGRKPLAVFEGDTAEATIRVREFIGYLRAYYNEG